MDYTGKPVLVTGASGFKGSWLCAALLRLGAQVYGTVTSRTHPRSAWSHLDMMSEIVRVQCDVSDRQATYDMLNTIAPNTVFHLAAKALVPVSLRDPRRTYEVNVTGTMNILEACRKLGVVQRLIICSTDHVFGSVDPLAFPAEGYREKARVSYGGPYDTSKSAMELIVRSYHKSYWTELPGIAITRCANVFGLGDVNLRRVIPLFVSAAASGKTIPLRYRNNGRQFIHVSDAIAGYLRAAESIDEGWAENKSVSAFPRDRKPFTPTYHFAIESYAPDSRVPYVTMKDLADWIARLLETTVEETDDCVDLAPNENPVQGLNCEDTRNVLGWAPRKNFDTAIRELAEWFQNENDKKRQSMLERDIQTTMCLVN